MGNNLYSNLVNFYNVNDENFKEFMAEIYKEMLLTHRDVQYVKEHLTEEIEKQLEKYLDDGKFNINIEEKVNEFLENNQEIKNISSQLEYIMNEQIPNNADGVNSIWYPPLQPRGKDIAPDTPLAQPSDYWKLWDDLMNENPSYITKTLLGKDTSNTYDIYKYVFEPSNYKKTVIIHCNTHGNEVLGQKIFYRFMVHICKDYKTVPQLAYMRNNIRFIVLPLVNPWGLANNTRDNVNSVNINQNFDNNWDSVPSSNNKGTAPFSEKESQYVRDVIQTYKDDTCLFVDIHNTGIQEGENYYCGYTSEGSINPNIFREIIDEIKPIPNPTFNIQGTTMAQSYCYARQFNINGILLEWVPGTMAEEQSALDVTYGLTFIANAIMRFSKENRPSIRLLETQQCFKVRHDSYQYTTTSTTWEEITELSITLNPKTTGTLEVYGVTTLDNNTNTKVYLAPVISQVGNVLIPPATEINLCGECDVFEDVVANARTQLSYCNVAKITPSSATTGEVKIKLFTKCDGGTTTIRKTRMVIKFTPNYANDRYVLLQGSNKPIS